MEEIINMSPDELYTKAIAFKQINDHNNYYIHMTMAANYGHSEAITCLDADYFTWENLTQNHSVTFSFYEQTKDFTYSLHYLAYMYRHGLGVEADHQKAIELYMRCVEEGKWAHSMNDLAMMYEHGIGVEKNYQKASGLYMRAIERGNKNAWGNLIDLYKCHKSLFMNEMISYLQENLAIKKENHELKKINKELMDHINLSPGGTEYFEVLNEWKNKLQDNNK